MDDEIIIRNGKWVIIFMLVFLIFGGTLGVIGIIDLVYYNDKGAFIGLSMSGGVFFFLSLLGVFAYYFETLTYQDGVISVGCFIFKKKVKVEDIAYVKYSTRAGRRSFSCSAHFYDKNGKRILKYDTASLGPMDEVKKLMRKLRIPRR